MEKYFFTILIIFIFFYSCKEKEKIDKEYYPNGLLKKEIKYINDSTIDKEIKSYDSNGVLTSKRNYSNGKRNGICESFDKNGSILFRGYFMEDSAIGPTYYFNNGVLKLYNERDFTGDIYYVKKYDTVTHALIKEEGACLSPNRVVKQFIGYQELYFFYAQPDGYINNIKAEINDQDIQVDIMKGHLGLIKLKMPDDIGKVVKIFSVLKLNSEIICQDSIQEFIVPRN